MRKGLILFFFPSLENQHIIPTKLTCSTVLQDYKEAEDKGFIHNSTLTRDNLLRRCKVKSRLMKFTSPVTVDNTLGIKIKRNLDPVSFSVLYIVQIKFSTGSGACR